MADLISLAKYKEFEGIDSTTNDLKFQTLIPSISQFVKTYCGNSFVDFVSTNKTETFTIDWDTHIVHLDETPIVSIVSVSERSSYSSSYTALSTASQEYFVDTDTDAILRTTASGYKNWPKGVGAVQVVYKAGYSDLPGDLSLAVVDLITYYFKKEHKERRTLGGASLQNPGTTSDKNNIGLPDHIKRVLDMYKQV